MGKFASDTQVPVMKSQQEIQTIIGRYGASSFMFGMKGNDAMIGFEFNNRQIKIVVSMSAREKFLRDHHGHRRTEKQVDEKSAQDQRQRWRCLALMVKAKLEAVDSGAATFEQEFLAYTVLPSGRTVAQELMPKLEEYYLTGKVPQLLLGTGE